MIRVMVVDDSPLVRKIASDILNSDPGVTVAATAATAEFALNKLERECPDVITMDIEMPGMGGLQAIREIMSRRPTPIIVLSAHAIKGAEQTLQALEAGAVEFVLKPVSSLSGGVDVVARELIEKVKSASGIVLKHRPEEGRAAPLAVPQPIRRVSRDVPVSRGPTGKMEYELVCVGTSTGGPIALKTLLSSLPQDFPLPILVVQHMPSVFTRAFAERLDSCCALGVKEAEDGEEIRPGQVLIAPGSYHMGVLRHNTVVKVTLSRREPVSGHRPSVDVLMRSVAKEYGSRAIGVIMTGMGKDGAEGIRELHQNGAYIIAQDRESSVIFGMNREVIENGDADAVLPVEHIAAALLDRVRPAVYV